MAGLLKDVVNIYQRGEEGVLVTLCSTKGSTPRKAGAKMLVYPDGRVKGTIGGGALEFDATKKALDVMKTKESILWEKELIDLEMICGGEATVYLEYLSGESSLS
ncbi:MAG: XdhC family protein [Syntrophaceticus sp.]|jgi:xanthine dehydrogenase accessory factor|nr:XdhC family protein [Syntrophaceticus sp.]MDD4783559.1 XdhC family protein [Syntrophaceticus sp.]